VYGSPSRRERRPAARGVRDARRATRARSRRARRAHGRRYVRRRGRARRATPRRRAASRSRRRRACAPWPRARRAPSLAEHAAAVLRIESFRELVERTLEHPVELVDRELDPVIGDATLGEVVGPDLLRALARADLRAARRGELGLLLRALELVEAGAENAQSLLLVLKLA